MPLSQHTRAYTQCSPTRPQVMGLSRPAIDTCGVALFLSFHCNLRARRNVQVPLMNQLMGRNYGPHDEFPVRPTFFFIFCQCV